MRSLIESTGLTTTFDTVLTMTESAAKTEFEYMNSSIDMREKLSNSENNGLGIYWLNINDANHKTYPKFQIYSQAFASLSAEVAKTLETALMIQKLTEV